MATFMWHDGRAVLSLSVAEFEYLFRAATGGGDYHRDCADQLCDECNVLDALHWLSHRQPEETWKCESCGRVGVLNADGLCSTCADLSAQSIH